MARRMEKMSELPVAHCAQFRINRSMTLMIAVFMISCALLPAYAAEVYKWADARGITHYSDEAPTSSTTPVSLIEVPATNSVTVDAESDYYSIANQWQRLHNERIAREKIKLEQAKLKAAQQPASSQTVKINEPQEKQYVAVYPGNIHRRHRHSLFYKKFKHQYVGVPIKRSRLNRPGRTHRKQIRLRSYKHLR